MKRSAHQPAKQHVISSGSAAPVDPTEAYQAARRTQRNQSLTIGGAQHNKHSRTGADQKRLTQVTGITFYEAAVPTLVELEKSAKGYIQSPVESIWGNFQFEGFLLGEFRNSVRLPKGIPAGTSNHSLQCFTLKPGQPLPQSSPHGFNPQSIQSSLATPMATQGPGTMAHSGGNMRLDGVYDGASTSANIGFHRASGVEAASNEEMTTLGGLIDVKPMKLHMMQSLEARKSFGGKGQDNLQTVLGNEKIMIQSKPRGGEVTTTMKSKIHSSRSRTKQGQVLSTQAKKEGGSEAELHSSDGVNRQEHKAATVDHEVRKVPSELPYDTGFDHDSSYRQDKSTKMTNQYINNKMQGVQMVRQTKIPEQQSPNVVVSNSLEAANATGKSQLTRSGFTSQQKLQNNDINQHLSDASLSASLNSLDFSRLVIQLQSVLEFSKEVDTADTFSLLRNFEQALGKQSNLNHSMFTVGVFQELFEHLLLHCKDHQVELQNQGHSAVVEALLRVMHEFLLFKANQHTQEQQSRERLVQEAEKTASVSMFYLNQSATGGFDSGKGPNDTVQSDALQKRLQEGAHPMQQKVAASMIDNEKAGASPIGQRKSSNPDVNEIIVKIEMKKFQNIIENKIQHKNNLLQADMKRVYPLTKKGQNGGMTLYDQHRQKQISPKRARVKSLTAKEEPTSVTAAPQSHRPTDEPNSLEQRKGAKQVITAGTDGGYSSTEDNNHNASQHQTTTRFDVSVQEGKTAQANQSLQSTQQAGAQEQSVMKRGSNEPVLKPIPDRSFEQSMPQSQLWFVSQNNQTMPHASRTQAQQRRPGAGTLLPAVRRSKITDMATSSKEYSAGRKGAKLNSKQPERRSLAASKDAENQRSRNLFQNQAQGHTVSVPDIYQEGQAQSSVAGDQKNTSITNQQAHMRPFNMGQNRGKFNQLKSLLQNSERVQTCDDIAILRNNNKHVLFDQAHKMQQQNAYGLTGFNLYQANKAHGGAYDQQSNMNAVSEIQGDNNNLMHIRDHDAVSAYVQDHNKMVSVQENDESFKQIGNFEFVDSQITNETASQRVRTTERGSSVGQIDVQKAFKNRVLQFQQLKSGSFMGANVDGYRYSNLDLDSVAQELTPRKEESQLQDGSSRSRLHSSLECSPMTLVNKLNQGMYTKLQYNASAISKRFTFKQQSVPARGQNTTAAGHLLGNHVVTHHPLFARTNSNRTEKERAMRASAKLEPFDLVTDRHHQQAAMPSEQGDHARLLRSIIAPDNPFAKMTEKDMLIFNPNYHAFLKKLKAKESMTSELSRIVSQPNDGKTRKQKKETALFAYMRVQQNNGGPAGVQSAGANKQVSKRPTNQIEKQTQSNGVSRSALNPDVLS